MTLTRVLRGEPIGGFAVTGTVLLGATGLGYLVLYFIRRKAPKWQTPKLEVMSDEQIRTEADRQLTEKVADVCKRDDYDTDVFRGEISAGIQGLCNRDLISSSEARWMLDQLFPFDEESGA